MDDLQALTREALAGSSDALEEIVRQLKDMIFGISLRMLYFPEAAEDATQEILIKIVTNLGTYREESQVKTWAMRIATNHLLTLREKNRSMARSFEEMEAMVVSDWRGPWKELESEPMQKLIVEEFRIACLQGLLLGLDRPHRLAYILGEIFDVSSREGADILEIQATTFRKRLQRSRSRIRGFLSSQCALVNPSNPCVCEQQTDYFMSTGELDHNRFTFAKHPCKIRHHPDVLEQLTELDELSMINRLLRSYPGIQAPPDFVKNLRKLISSTDFRILNDHADETAP